MSNIAASDIEIDSIIYSDNLDKSQWNWPDLTEKELETAIFSSSKKSAAGPDKIGFLIIQKAYQSIPQLFYQLYYRLIKIGYHPDI